MSRSSLFIICATIICGLLLGWTGAVLLHYFYELADETQSIADDSPPPTQPQGILPEPPKTSTNKQSEDPAPPITQEPISASKIVAEITGAVRRPGVYTFKKGTRVKDGIREAGGTTREADLSDINIAAKLMDNTSLYIPWRLYHEQNEQSLVARRTLTAAQSNPPRYTRSGWAYGTPPGIPSRIQPIETPAPSPGIVAPAAASPSNGLININTASLDELQKLPGIGPKTAEKIDAHRQTQPFQSISDLESVNGIGPKTMDAVRDMITVQ